MYYVIKKFNSVVTNIDKKSRINKHLGAVFLPGIHIVLIIYVLKHEIFFSEETGL